MKLDPVIADQLWRMYKEGQISADHTAKQVFIQTLESFATWRHQKTVDTCIEWVDYSYSLWSNGDPRLTKHFANFTKRQLETLKENGTTGDGLSVPSDDQDGSMGAQAQETSRGDGCAS